MESKHGDSSSDSEEDHRQPSAKNTPEDSKGTEEDVGTAGTSRDGYDLGSSAASRLCDYLYMDDDLSDCIEEFVSATAGRFTDAEPTDGSDHSLDQHALFLEYADLVETNLTAFAEKSGLSPSELLGELSAALSSEGDLSSGENLAAAILALTSFSEFRSMMKMFVRDGISPCVCPPLLNEEGELEFRNGA